MTETQSPKRLSARQRRYRRMGLAVGALAVLAAAFGLVLTALSESVAFFKTPSELAAASYTPDSKPVRLGGLVVPGSIDHADGTHFFDLTDNEGTITVAYAGVLPDLFREGQGIIATGMLGQDGRFTASEVLAKHDENYMPAEVARALKEKGYDHDSGAYGGTASPHTDQKGGPGTP